MDYVPAKPPALIAQAIDSAPPKRKRTMYTISDFGEIDQMPQFDDWHGGPDEWETDPLRKLKPIPRTILAQADKQPGPDFYIEERPAPSVVAYNAFVALINSKPDDKLTPTQIKPIVGILGDKADSATHWTQFYIDKLGGRRGISAYFSSNKHPQVMGRSFYLVSDSKRHFIQELGFEGARKPSDDYWHSEADTMLQHVQFVKPH